MGKIYVLDARTATAHFPGIGRYVSCLAEALLPQLGDDEALTLLCDPTALSAWTPPESGTQLRLVEAPISPFSLRQQLALPRLLSKLGADVYHSCYYLMPYWPGLPTLLTVYDMIPLLFPRQSSLRARLLFRWATWLALRSAARVLTISETTRQDLLESFDVSPDVVAAIPLAAGPEFRARPSSEVDAMRRRRGLPDRYLLFVGSNKPHKNLPRLVEAWGRVQSSAVRHARWGLVIAGSWDEGYPEPRRRAQELGLGESVCWLGRVGEDELPALYTGASAFVSPSLYEGFGLPVLEAMACGIPVACSDCPGLLEVVGDAAVVFDATRVDGIAASLRMLLADSELRARLGERGARRAAQYSWEKTAKLTLAAYRQIAGRSP
jgi:glycosyltransferase involved in cell wall biosynthesis